MRVLWFLLLFFGIHISNGNRIIRQYTSQNTRAIAATEHTRETRSRRLDHFDQARAQHDAYRKQLADMRERYYDEYFDRMREYGRNLQRQRYMQLLAKQAQERDQIGESMRYWNAEDAIVEPVTETARRPSDPFSSGAGRTKGATTTRETGIDTLPQLPSSVVPRPGQETSHRQAVALQSLCQRFLPTVRLHCHGDKTEKAYEKKCIGYFQDCQQYITQADPLYAVAHSFTSGVDLNLGTWAAKGIPYYPINEEGTIGAGRVMSIPFGSWGGGYSDHIGVRDYWSQYQEVGANWYDGKYGYKSGWSVPLVQSLGIEGDTHATVSVPIKQGELGKPIGVDVGGGVGPYYQQNQHVGVDYVNGQVGTNFGVGVPMAGVGVNTGLGIKFPSIADITG